MRRYREIRTKEITSNYKQNSEEILKSQDLLGWKITVSHPQSLQPSKYSQGEKWPQGRHQIMGVAVRSFVKMCKIFKLVFGRPSQLS